MQQKPIILGIVGDSAAGKTTLAYGLAAVLGAGNVSTLSLDDYHRYSRAERTARNITALHPDGNDLDLMEEHLRRLAVQEPIIKPVYNHATGTFSYPQRVDPAPFVLVEGLLAFSTPRLRDCYDLKVYLDPPDELRRRWKIARDCARRGYTPEQAIAEIERRQPDAVEFIHPQRGWADIVVRFHPASPDGAGNDLSARLVLRPSASYPDLSAIIGRQRNGRPTLHLRVGRDEGRLTEILTIDGHVSAAEAEAVEEGIWARLPRLRPQPLEQLGAVFTGSEPGHSRTLAITQLLLAYQLTLKAKQQVIGSALP